MLVRNIEWWNLDESVRGMYAEWHHLWMLLSTTRCKLLTMASVI